MSFMIQNAVEIGKPFIGLTRLSAWGFVVGNKSKIVAIPILDYATSVSLFEWVQENIAAFWGNSTKFTIFGELAGAMSVGFHLVAYGGRNDKLFRGAIMESGAPVYYHKLDNNAEFEPKYQSSLNAIGCANLVCLRALHCDDLNRAINGTRIIEWGPAIDYDLIQPFTSTQLLSGNFVQVPIRSGANSDENTAFGPRGVDSEQDFIDALTTFGIPSKLIRPMLHASPTIPSLGIPGSPPLSAGFRFTLPQGSQYRRTSAYFGDH